MRSHTRRRYLAMFGTGAVAGMAGCLGGSEDGGAPEPNGDAVRDLPTPALGDADASVTVEVYTDFSCPHCKDFKRQITPRLVEDYVDAGIATYAHRDFPLPVDDWSWPVASAARAVQDEAGVDAFWQFATAIYDHQGEYSVSTIESVADAVADVGAAAGSAAEELTYVPVVEADKERGLEAGVDRTPTVFVDGEAAPLDYAEIAAAIENAG